MLIIVLSYLFLCALTGLGGTERRLGFVGTFLLAILLTPILVLPLLFVTGPSRRIEWRHRD